MFIKSLELTNVQKHSHLVLTFANGINIIYGQTDSGKSCIIRAIRWLFFNDVSSDVIRKEGTKKTSVKVELDNGAIVERIRTDTINRYILTIGKEVKEFDSIGKDIPEEIKKIIQVRPIEIDKESLILNVSKQISMPFLMDKPGSFRMKLFNLLTGNDIIDKVMQDLNKDILQIGREEKSEVVHLEEFRKDLETVEKDKEQIRNLSCVFSTEFEQLKKWKEKYDLLKEHQNLLLELDFEVTKITKEIDCIKIPQKQEIPSLKQKVDKFEKMSTLKRNLTLIVSEFETVNNQLSQLIIPQIDTKDLSKKIDKLNNLKKLQEKCSQTEQELEKTTNTLKIVDKDTIICKETYKKLLQKLEVCPLCKTVLTEEKIKEMINK